MDMKFQNRNHVISAEADIQHVFAYYMHPKRLDSRFRWNDEQVGQQWRGAVQFER